MATQGASSPPYSTPHHDNHPGVVFSHGDDDFGDPDQLKINNGDGNQHDQHSQDTTIQTGVYNAEATTTAWSKKTLVVAYAMIWAVYFVDALQSGATGALTPYVTSEFSAHSLTATVDIVSSIVSGVLKLTLAKILDVFGRPQGYLLCICLTTLGLVMMAACGNVETYAAAQVFYSVGNSGIIYCLTVFVADTSSLRNRGLAIAYSLSPYIITTWISGPVAEAFENGPGFRWGFGAFAVITPFISMPLYILFVHNLNKARKMGFVSVQATSGRSRWESLCHYAREFDMVGLILLSVGLAMFLLPFSIYTLQDDGWRSPLIICLVVFGIVLLCLFAAWERFWAPIKCIPWSLLTDRTAIGACVVGAITWISYFIWNSYFGSFLQVVNGLSITQATYVGNVYNVGSCFWGLVVGYMIRRTGRFKWLALYFGLPLMILGVGLMIKFRQPDVNIGYVIMCQIFIAFAGGTVVICLEIAAMAAVSHQYVAVIVAVINMFAGIGGAVGGTVSAAIWQAVFRGKLNEYLDGLPSDEIENIYGDIKVQLGYEWGSEERMAIQRAYGDGQQAMLIGATAILALALVAAACWRDINVNKAKQVKGNVV